MNKFNIPYTSEMGEAGDAYIRSKAFRGQYNLPVQFRWHELFDLMLDLADTTPEKFDESPIERLLSAIEGMEGQQIEYRVALQLNAIHNALKAIQSSSRETLATEPEPLEILAQTSEAVTSNCCSIPLDEIEQKRLGLAAEFEMEPDSYVVESRLMNWIEAELDKRGVKE